MHSRRTTYSASRSKDSKSEVMPSTSSRCSSETRTPFNDLEETVNHLRSLVPGSSEFTKEPM